MAYRRKGRDQWYADLPTEAGWWKGAALRTTSKPLALRIEQMWNALAREHRAWDVLGAVLEDRLTIAQLYDHWIATKYDVPAIRRRLDDTDLRTLVKDFLTQYRGGAAKDEQADRLERHLTFLMPEGAPFLASQATTKLLTAKLHAYGVREVTDPKTGATTTVGVKRNTRRAVHSSWSTFFDYCRRVHGALDRNPMDDVPRPKLEKPPLEFYELETVQRIVAWQPTDARRALLALVYGTGLAELSVVLTLTRADVWPVSKEIRAAGTKAHTRDRVVRVDDWAWEEVWRYARDLLPTAPLFPGMDRWTVSDWHRQTVGAGTKDTHGRIEHEGLQLPKRLKLYAARHAWAVRWLRAGVPPRVVQLQLGHATTKETMDTYGPFIPSGEDRAQWAAHVAAAEEKRREAK